MYNFLRFNILIRYLVPLQITIPCTSCVPTQNPRTVLKTTLPLDGANGTYQLPFYKMLTGYDRGLECKSVKHPKRIFNKYETVGKGMLNQCCFNCANLWVKKNVYPRIEGVIFRFLKDIRYRSINWRLIYSE